MGWAVENRLAEIVLDKGDKRWHNVRTDRTGPDGRLKRRFGKREYRRRLFCVGGRVPAPTWPESRLHECARHRPLPADSGSWLNRNQIQFQGIQWTGRGTDRHVGDLQIARGGFQVGMAEQNLNAAEISAGFE